VSVLSFTQGEVINSTDFVEVVNLEEVELSIDVPENVVPRIKRGAPVMAKAASAARYGLEGVVLGHSILPDENRSYRVRAALDNPNQRLLPGMLMEVQIQVSQVQPRFVVPRQAVVTDGTAHFLFFAKEGQAVKVPVDLGAGRQGLVQVDGDMTDGDLLVIEGQSYLRAGSPVTVKETRGYLPDRIEL
jgi:membrane fusion protein (multidrug efflux system)